MPFGEYKNFADCKSKNKDKDSPDAYCGYIKHQIEGGAKKEECLEAPEHEAYHLEEDLKKMEATDYVCPACGSRDTGEYEKSGVATCWKCGNVFNISSDFEGMKEEEKFRSADSVMNLALHKEDENEVKRLEEEIAKLEEEKCAMCNGAGVDEYGKKCGYCGGKGRTPPYRNASLLREASAFVETLKATVDEVTLMAKDEGWASTSGVSEKVAPGEGTYKLEVTGENVPVAVKQAKGGGTVVQINWFNTVMAELKDIVADANDFFQEAGWNSKEVVKEYNEHKKHWGKDYTAGT
jgi:ribosomal protein L37AE/L43A